MLFNCYTVSGTSIIGGIDINTFDSIVADQGETVADYAELSFIPILPYRHPTLQDDAHLSLAFLKAVPEGDADDGMVVAVDCREWYLCRLDPSMLLLDPGGRDSKALLWLPPNKKYLLAHKDGDKILALNTRDIVPEIVVMNRAALMLSGMNIDVTGIFPERLTRSDQASPKALPACRKTRQQAGQPRQARKARQPKSKQP